MATYDGVIVLCGGIEKRNGKYYAAGYKENDGFGMLGGYMRLMTALILYLQNKTHHILFTTGITPKDIARFGKNVPSEGMIYASQFLIELHTIKKHRYKASPPPIIIVEEKSTTTLENIRDSFDIILKNKWRRIAIITNHYHLPRVKALYVYISKMQKRVQTVQVSFLDAEKIMKTFNPLKYTKLIDAAYKSRIAKKRITNEHKGLSDLKNGKYKIN